MKKSLVCLCCFLVTLIASAGKHMASVELWPKDKIPFRIENATPEGVLPVTDDIVRICNVSIPQIVIVRALGETTSPTPAVVICPGGGYGILAWNHEGVEVAHWLKDQGFTAIILKYRVPEQRTAALADAQRAIRYVRANAKKLNVDPAKIGIMGFSAGANLAVRAATNWRKGVYESVDAIDQESCRPDFHLPIYPWDLITRKNPENPWKGHSGLSIRTAEYPVDSQTPPAFIVQTEDDFCEIETSLAYYAALKQAKVSAEMHLYAQGGHGYGLRKNGLPLDAWPDLAVRWLKQFKP